MWFALISVIFPAEITGLPRSRRRAWQRYEKDGNTKKIDKQAQERFERLIEGMKQAQGITERLKTENALEWVGKMNNIRACAMEIVNEEIIYA